VLAERHAGGAVDAQAPAERLLGAQRLEVAVDAGQQLRRLVRGAVVDDDGLEAAVIAEARNRGERPQQLRRTVAAGQQDGRAVGRVDHGVHPKERTDQGPVSTIDGPSR
jgi:hypothetical protein